MENTVMPVKTAFEVEQDLKKEYEKKLRVDDRLIPDPFKIPPGWRNGILANAVISRYIKLFNILPHAAWHHWSKWLEKLESI